eukprot:jgi/Chlat1/8783/Chrsp90S09249
MRSSAGDDGAEHFAAPAASTMSDDDNIPTTLPTKDHTKVPIPEHDEDEPPSPSSPIDDIDAKVVGVPLPVPYSSGDAADAARKGLVWRLRTRLGRGKDGGKEGKGPPKEKQPMAPFMSLFRYADRKDWLYMLLGTLCSIAVGAMTPAFSVLFGRLTNAFGNNLSDPGALVREVNRIVIILAILSGAAGLCGYAQKTFWMLAGARLTSRVRERYLHAVLRQEVAYFDTEAKSGDLVTRIAGDTEAVAQATSEKMSELFQYITTFLGGFAVGFVYAWKLTLVMLAITPLIALCGVALMAFVARFHGTASKSYGEAGAVATEAVANARTVAAFNGQEQAAAAYSRALSSSFTAAVRQGVAQGVSLGAVFFILYCSYSLSLWYGGQLVAKREINGGDVLSVFFAVLLAGFSLGQALPLLSTIAAGRGAAYRLYSAVDRVPLIDNDAGVVPTTPPLGQIELRDVTFAYPARPDVTVFNNFNLKVHPGQTVALVGETGSGKSTAISLLERFYDPLSGVILLDGVDIKTLQPHWLRSQIGLVSQEPILFATTIRANIEYGKPGASFDDIVAAAKAANAHNFISALPDGYETQVGERGLQLSGGQKQRIAIARAVLKNPRILLLDEATSALDNESERIVQAALDSLMVNRTTLVVAHRLSTVRDANAIAVVRAGKVVELGTHEELLKIPDGAYAALVRLQNDPREVERSSSALLRQRRNSNSSQHHHNSFHKAESHASYHDTGKYGRANDEEAGLDNNKKKRHGGWMKALSRAAGMTPGQWLLILVGVIGAGVSGATSPVFSIVLSNMVTVFFRPTPEGVRSGARLWALVFLALAVGAFVASYMEFYAFTRVGARVVKRLRELTFGAILRQEVAFFDDDRNASGAVAARLEQDAAAVKVLVGDRAAMIVQNMVRVVAGVAIAFSAGPKLAGVLICILPLMAFAGWIQFGYLQRSSAAAADARASANQLATESMQSIRTVAAFGAEGRVVELFAERNVAPYKQEIIRAHAAGLGQGLSQLASNGMFALGFWYGGKLFQQGEITFQGALQVLYAIMMTQQGLGWMGTVAPDIAKADHALENAFTVVDRKPAIDASDPGGAQLDAKIVKGDVELSHVTFTYPSRPDAKVFEDFSLRVRGGETVALVGESGSGKSTVISLVERFYDPQAGRVLFDGVDIRNFNVKWLRSQIGLVSQEPVLFGTSIRANIEYGNPGASFDDIVAAAKAANAHNFIVNLPEAYDTQVGERGIQLSGGQKQRIAIARAVLRNPRLLLLDEATSALDSGSERLVQEALDKLMQNRTTLVVAHRLSTIRHADRIAVVREGKVIEIGTHEELLKIPDGAYAALARARNDRAALT